ncbi:TPA: fimbria/pilus outer membrane usher protein [Klebsiella aerogenes]|nr:fimbria/pilus outer membrane usher protein [Klebsiella aerogenes]
MIRTVFFTVFIVIFVSYSRAEEFRFDAAFLGKNVSEDSLTMLGKGQQLPGKYNVNIFVNEHEMERRDVMFNRKATYSNGLYPCLTVEQLIKYGVKSELLAGREFADNETCVDIESATKGSVNFMFNEQRLLLIIPQASLDVSADNELAPIELWNDGVPAALLNYNAGHDETHYKNGRVSSTSMSDYVFLEPGVNLFSWHVRSALSWESEVPQWQRQYIYADKGVYELKSRISMGERSTSPDIFDSVPFRGVMLASDDNMVPYRLRVQLPEIRGTARTQAQVKVLQNGYLIYQTSVPPGPFVLTDFPSGAARGDLLVRINEQDGSYREFTVPYQPPVIALREGYLKYEAMAGTYRTIGDDSPRPRIGQLTLAAGLPRGVTAFGGVQYSGKYQAESLGAGYSLGSLGGLSGDIIMSQVRASQMHVRRGHKWRLRYSKSFSRTGGRIQLSQQVVSKTWRTPGEVLDTSWPGSGREAGNVSSSISFSQPIGQSGDLSVNGYRNRYGRKATSTFDVRYSYGLGRWAVAFGIGTGTKYQHQGSNRSTTERTGTINISYFPGHDVGSVEYQMVSSSQGGTAQQISVGGSGEGQRLNWNISHSDLLGQHSRVNEPSSTAANLAWSGNNGRVAGYYRYGSFIEQGGGSLSGGMILHRHGLTLGQTLDRTIALTEAPGAVGVSVIGQPGVATDFHGYAISNLSSLYRDSLVRLDPLTLPEDAEITKTDMHIVATEGAVIPVRFHTRVGSKAIFMLRRPEGKNIAFGATVSTTTKENEVAGIVDETGRVYLSGLPHKGTLYVRWGRGRSESCQADYILSSIPHHHKLYSLSVICH